MLKEMPCAPSICAAERIPLGRICRWRSYASIRVTRVKVMQPVPTAAGPADRSGGRRVFLRWRAIFERSIRFESGPSDCHPSFAIDGNTAGTSGIAEMLLQSHEEVHLLPALPRAWPNGWVRGLRARGGFAVDLNWRNGVLASATIRSERGGSCQVRYGARAMALSLKAGETARFNQNLLRLRTTGSGLPNL